MLHDESTGTARGPLYDVGHHLGVIWACRHATNEEIFNLDGAWRGLDPIQEDAFLIPDGDNAYSAAELIHSLITGEDVDRQECRDFWDTYAPSVEGGAIEDPDFLRGFIDGAGVIQGD